MAYTDNPGVGIREYFTFERQEIGCDAGMCKGELLVNLASGNFIARFIDIDLPFYDTSLRVNRTYNSLGIYGNNYASFGANWYSVMNMVVWQYDDTYKMMFIDENGTQWMFSMDSGTSYETGTPPAELEATIRVDWDEPKIYITYKDGTLNTFFYEDTNGNFLIESIQTPSGIKTLFEYDANCLVQKMHICNTREPGQPIRRSLTIKRDANSEITRICIDGTDKYVSYSYTNQRLTGFTNTASLTHAYAYEGSSPYRLNSITNYNSQAWTTQYISSGDSRISRLTRPQTSNPYIAYAYPQDGQMTRTDEDSRVWTYNFSKSYS